MKIKCIFSSCLMLLMASIHTQAMIIDGTFTGKVTHVTDLGASDTEYTQYWQDDVVNTAISGSFWYNTDLAPGNSSATPNQAVHTSAGDFLSPWLGINISIGGKVVDISNSIPAGLDIVKPEKTVVFEDYQRPVNRDDSDYFAIADVSNASNSAGDYDYKWVTLTVREPILNMVNGTSLEQEFRWVNINDRDFISLGYFNVKGLAGTEKFDAYASLKLSSLSLSIRNEATVPEPSPIMLLVVGLFALGLRILKLNRGL